MKKLVITTASGVDVSVRSVGSGPGLVVLHGGAVGLRDYQRLATALTDRFTVHLYNRRGRPDAAPLDRRTYSIATDLEDLAAVLQHTGASNFFGHSGGGFVALRPGLSLPVSRIAVYDPGLAVSGRPSFAFLAAFAAAVDEGDYPRALSEMTRGVYPDGALTAGARSPRYFAENCAALAEAIPRGRALVLPRMAHNAANVAAPDFVAPFRDFFAGAVRPVGA